MHGCIVMMGQTRWGDICTEHCGHRFTQVGWIATVHIFCYRVKQFTINCYVVLNLKSETLRNGTVKAGVCKMIWRKSRLTKSTRRKKKKKKKFSFCMMKKRKVWKGSSNMKHWISLKLETQETSINKLAYERVNKNGRARMSAPLTGWQLA